MPPVEAKRARLKELVRAAVKTGPIKLASGKLSDFYFDGRLVTLSQEGAFLLSNLMLPVLLMHRIDSVGGLSIGADPIISSVGLMAYQKDIPMRMVYVRKAVKDHGTGKLVEGPAIPPNSRAAVVEDVVTSGASALQAAKAIRSAFDDVIVDTVLCLVDREEGGREMLESEGLFLHAIFRKGELLK